MGVASFSVMFACAFLFMMLCMWIVRERPLLAPAALGFWDGFVSHSYTGEPQGAPSAIASPKKTPAPFARKRLTPLQKKKVGALAHWRCQLCKKELDHTYEVDHIRPVSQGGTNEFSNLRALCRGCHGRVSMAAYVR